MPCGRVRRYLGQLLEGEEALAALRRGVQLLQRAVDAQVCPRDPLQICLRLNK